MCDPISLGIAAISIGAVGTAVSVGGSIMSGYQQQQLAEYQADQMEYQANEAKRLGEKEEKEHRKDIERLKGAQRAAFGASGATVDIGSPEDVLADTAYQGEKDALTIRHNAALQAWGYQSQANLYKSQASNALTRGWMGGGTSLLTGVAQGFSTYATMFPGDFLSSPKNNGIPGVTNKFIY